MDGHGKPIASGTCQGCGSTYHRYQSGTGFGPYCASCALTRNATAPDERSR